MHEIRHASHIKYLIRSSTSTGHGLCFEVNINYSYFNLSYLYNICLYVLFLFIYYRCKLKIF